MPRCKLNARVAAGLALGNVKRISQWKQADFAGLSDQKAAIDLQQPRGGVEVVMHVLKRRTDSAPARIRPAMARRRPRQPRSLLRNHCEGGR